MSQTDQNVVVLVADDEPSTLALVSSHVRSRGYKVLEASDGDQAWQLAHEHLPDLVILDVMMPGMSGWEVCRKIREAVSLAHTGVIMLTGIGENLNEMTSPLYGADAYLDKPFEFAELDAKLTATLEERREGAMGRPDPDAVPRRQTEPPPAGANGMGVPAMARSPQAAAKRRAEREVEDPDEPAETEAEMMESSAMPTKRVALGRPTKKMTPPTPKKKAAAPATKVATKTSAATPAAKKKAKPAANAKKAAPAAKKAAKKVGAKKSAKAAPVAKKAAKAAPVAKKSAKKSAKAAPVAKKAAKKSAKAAPVAKKSAKAAPVAKRAAPVAKRAAPVAKRAAPVAKKASKAAPAAKAAPKKANSSAKKMAGAQAM